MRRLSVAFFRMLFGLMLLATALGKLLDNRGFAELIAAHQLGIPSALLLPLGLVISLAELLVGLAICAGSSLRVMSAATLSIQAAYLGLALATNVRGLRLANCGCFGVFLARPLTWFTVFED